MYEVYVHNPKEHVGSILFNYLYSRRKDEFTIEELQNELNEKFNLDLTYEELFGRINDYIRNGMVMRTARGYIRQTLV